MKIGVTGHQDRQGIQWSWVEQIIKAQLSEARPVSKGLSSLATGTDQVFAEAALDIGIPVVAVLPLERYEQFFEGSALLRYRALLPQCEVVQLNWGGDPQQGFFEAGKYIVDECDLLIAVWDGERAEGLGGTADIVSYATGNRRPVVHINPCSKIISRL